MNLLSSVQPFLMQKIMEMRVAEAIKSSIPTQPSFEDQEPKSDSPGNPFTSARERVANKISSEAKEKFNAAKEEAKEQFENAKQAVIDKVNNAVAENLEELTKLASDINDLGISLGELMTTCVAFPVRFAIAAPSIIGSCPVGPTVQPTQLVMTLKQFKEVGDDMGTKYSKAQGAWNKLDLDNLINSAKSNPVIAMIPGFAATLSPLSAIFTTVTTVFNTTKPFITMVGGSVCEVKPPSVPKVSISLANNIEPRGIQTYAGDGWPGPFGISEEQEEGKEAEVKAPSVESDCDPEACFNFVAKSGTTCSAANCKNFKALKKDDGITCDNCSKYKPIHKQLKIRLKENTMAIYGSDDLFLDGSTFTPLDGSLLSRMAVAEGKISELEGKVALLGSTVSTASLSAGVTDDNKIWVGLKKSDENDHSATINLADISQEQGFDPRVKEVKRVDIYKVSSLPSYIDSNSFSSGEYVGVDSETNEIIFKGDEVPETDRIDGNTYVVFIFENGYGPWMKPLWINVSLLSVKYDFMTTMDSTTKNYLTLDWQKVPENHSVVVTANLKYNSEVGSVVNGLDAASNSINEAMKGISSVNGQGRINDNKE